MGEHEEAFQMEIWRDTMNKLDNMVNGIVSDWKALLFQLKTKKIIDEGPKSIQSQAVIGSLANEHRKRIEKDGSEDYS